MTAAWPVNGLLIGILLAVVALPASAANDCSDVTCDSTVVGRLHADVVVPRETFQAAGLHTLASPSPIDFPAGATQGPTTWFLLRIHLRLRFDGPLDGDIVLYGSTLERAAAQIRFSQPGPGEAGVVATLLTTGLVFGNQVEAVRSNEYELDFWNYVQDTGVRGGEQPWALFMENRGASTLAEIVVRSDTGVYATGRSPYQLGLELSGPGAVEPGDDFSVRARVVSRQGHDLGDVTLDTSPSDVPGLGEPTTQLPVSGAGATVELRFRAPAELGQHTITVLASTRANQVVVNAPLEVVADLGGGGSALAALAGALFGGVAGGTLAGVAGVAARTRRRHSRT